MGQIPVPFCGQGAPFFLEGLGQDQETPGLGRGHQTVCHTDFVILALTGFTHVM